MRQQISLRLEERIDRLTIVKLRGGNLFLGNMLRRALASWTIGWAVVAFRFEGQLGHQFISKVVGVVEDVSMIFTNFKKLTLIGNYGEATYFKAKINTNGKSILTGGDIILPLGVGITNPRQCICHLKNGAPKIFEVLIAKGRGFMSEGRAKNVYNRGQEEYIWTNVNFNPIKTVTCLNINSNQVSIDGFDCKLVFLNGGINKSSNVISEVCRTLVSQLSSVKVSLSTEFDKNSFTDLSLLL